MGLYLRYKKQAIIRMHPKTNQYSLKDLYKYQIVKMPINQSKKYIK
jgi:hypothetical protein